MWRGEVFAISDCLVFDVLAHLDVIYFVHNSGFMNHLPNTLLNDQLERIAITSYFHRFALDIFSNISCSNSIDKMCHVLHRIQELEMKKLMEERRRDKEEEKLAR